MVLVPAAGAAGWYGHVELAEEVHPLLANAPMLVPVGHAGLALWHHYIVKEGTLRRMTRPCP